MQNKRYIVTPEKRREYHDNRKRKQNMPLVEQAVKVVRILKAQTNITYDDDLTLSPGQMRKKLLEWIFENLPPEPAPAVIEI